MGIARKKDLSSSYCISIVVVCRYCGQCSFLVSGRGKNGCGVRDDILSLDN